MKEEAFNYYCIYLLWVQLVMTQTPSHSSEYHIFKSHYNQTFTNNLYFMDGIWYIYGHEQQSWASNCVHANAHLGALLYRR